MKQKILPLILTSVLCIMAFSTSILPAKAAEFNFAVNTVIPENQVDKQKTYYDLRMEPGQQQTIEIELKNDSDKEIKIQPSIHTATTNRNGVVEYGEREIERDSTLKYAIEDIVKTEEIVTIPSKETYLLQMEINMPDEDYDGILAGGITLEEVESDEDEEEDAGSGMAIKNKYAYVVGIVLSVNDNEVTPAEETMLLTKVWADQVNYRNTISANLQNILPMYMNKMSVDAKVSKKGGSETLYEASNENMQMAPNSNFDFPIPLNGERYAAGDYTLRMTVESMDQTWHFEQDFTITTDEARRLNEADVTIVQDNTMLYIIIGVAVFVVLLLILIIVRSKKKSKKMQQELEQALLKKMQKK